MFSLPDAWTQVMDVLLDSPVAWSSPEAIAEALGRGLEETTDWLCDLDVAGWIDVWEAEPGPLVTLSALAAARLGARLVEVGPEETTRWARAGQPDPPQPRPRNVCRGERAASLAFVVDPGPSPEEAAERSEQAEAEAADATPSDSQDGAPRSDRRDELPRPTILIGQGLTPWPGPPDPDAIPCPACGGRTLGAQMYCLYCDRWGLDQLAAAVAAAGRPASRPGRGLDRDGPDAATRTAEAERLRARRKSRRRRRRGRGNKADRPTAPSNPPGKAGIPKPRA